MITVVIAMSTLWIAAGVAVAFDGGKARKSIDEILLNDAESLRREPSSPDQLLHV